MERRSFLGTVTCLAATAVVGGLPALAGGSLHPFPPIADKITMPEFFSLCSSPDIMRIRVRATGLWKVRAHCIPACWTGVPVALDDLTEADTEWLLKSWREAPGRNQDCVHVVHFDDVLMPSDCKEDRGDHLYEFACPTQPKSSSPS